MAIYRNLEQVSSVLFFNYWQASNLLKVATIINDEMNVFDGEPFILPINTDAPSQIPRIILKSKNENVRLEISLERHI